MVAKNDDGTYRLDHDRPQSIGRVRTYFGNVGVLFRAYCYIKSQGPDGLKAVAQHAVLNANYLMSLVKHVYPGSRWAIGACTSSSPRPGRWRGTGGSGRWTSPSG